LETRIKKVKTVIIVLAISLAAIAFCMGLILFRGQLINWLLHN